MRAGCHLLALVTVLAVVKESTTQLLLNTDIHVYGKVPRDLIYVKRGNQNQDGDEEAMPNTNGQVESNPTKHNGADNLPQNHPPVQGDDDICPSTGVPLRKKISGDDCEAMFESKQWSKALNCFENDPKLSSGSMPEISHILERRGDIHLLLDSPKQALKLLDEAVKLREFVGGETARLNCATRVKIGTAAEMAQNWSYARITWERLVTSTNCACTDTKLDDQQAIGHNRLGMFAHMMSDFPVAIERFSKSVQVWRDCAAISKDKSTNVEVLVHEAVMVLFNQAIALIESNDANAAIRIYERIPIDIMPYLRDDGEEAKLASDGSEIKSQFLWQHYQTTARAGVVAATALHSGNCAQVFPTLEGAGIEDELEGNYNLLRALRFIACRTSIDVDGNGNGEMDEAASKELVSNMILDTLAVMRKTTTSPLHPVMVTAKRLLKAQA